MHAARREFMQAVELLVDPFEGGGKDLLAPQRLLGSARKILAARFSLAPRLPLFLPCQRPRLVALFPQARLQRMQLLGGKVVDGRMVRDADRFELIVTELATLGLAGDRHSSFSSAEANLGSR